MALIELAAALAGRGLELRTVGDGDLAAPVIDDAFFVQRLRNQRHGRAADAKQRGDLFLRGGQGRHFHALVTQQEPAAEALLGAVHGGAGEQCFALYNAIAARLGDSPADERRLTEAVVAEIAALAQRGIRHVPGFGHRLHPRDPRAPRLLELVDRAAAAGAVSGRCALIGRAIEARLAADKGRPIPMNIDGATGVVFAELGFPPPLCRGLFVLSRSVGALAHAFEELLSGERNKGPIPRQLIWTYTGPPARELPQTRAGG